jgi:hypothetical protein
VHTGLNYNHLFDSAFFNAEFGLKTGTMIPEGGHERAVRWLAEMIDCYEVESQPIKICKSKKFKYIRDETRRAVCPACVGHGSPARAGQAVGT